MTLKLLFIINGLGTGGTERSVAEMLPHLIQANVKPIITCFYRRQEGVEQSVLDQGFDVRFLTSGGLVSRVRVLRQLIATERPDLIHTTHFEADLAGRLAVVGSSVPLMGSLVSTNYDRVRFKNPNINPTKLRIVQVIDSLTARYLTRHLHAVSKTVKAAAIKSMWIPPGQITVVERGRDPQRLGEPSAKRRRQARQRLGLGVKDEVIVHVGRHEFPKGQKYLLEAMASLAHSHSQLVLLIAGRSGNASAELERLRDQISMGERIRFLGHRDDIPEVLAAADLFVFPSLFEGFPGAVIEAMALGLPIIASNIPAVREMVVENRNALLVEPGTSAQLAAAVESLLKNRTQAAAFGHHSREIFERHFTLERSASRMVELYHRVAAMHHNPKMALDRISSQR